MSGTQRRRIVITGMGVVSPLGTGNETFWQGLASGRSGVAELTTFSTGGHIPNAAGEVRDFDPKRYVKQRKSLKVMARDIQLAVGCAELLMEHAGIDPNRIDPTRFGVECGAGMIATDLDELGPPVAHSINGTNEFDLKKWGAEGMEQLFPLWMLKWLPNMPACHISINYNAQGPNNSITAGEASATLAMGEAYRILERGAADLFIVGGADSKIHPLSFVRLALLGRMSRGTEEPGRRSRPFDVHRSGLVPGEGAGLLTFEALEHAQARGAKIHAEVVGFGAACHPGRSGVAIEKAAAAALREAGLTPADLGHVVPNGVAGRAEDREETIALARLLGDAAGRVPVVAYKGYWGHLGAASGAVELIASLLALHHRVLVPTLNFEAPDPDLPRLAILSEKIDRPPKPFLTYDLSHSGQCAALVIRPFEEQGPRGHR